MISCDFMLEIHVYIEGTYLKINSFIFKNNLRIDGGTKFWRKKLD
jgi:hypothetical protein